MGTPEFAVPSLKLLYYADHIDILAVITQPDRPAGRGKKLQQSPVKQFALQHEIPIFQPEKLKECKQTLSFLQASNADAFVTVAFGQILTKDVLDLPRIGTINLHASLLPKYRGANPIQRAVLNGDSITGVTTMLTDEGVDCGDMLLKHEIPILIDDTTLDLAIKMSAIGSRMLVDSLKGLDAGVIKPIKQKDEEATKARKMKKSAGNIKWESTTWKIHNLIRGSKPWPGAYSYFDNKPIKIHLSYLPPIHEDTEGMVPGTIKNITHNAIRVCTGDGYIDVLEVQPPNKPKIKASSWAQGARLKTGDRFVYDPLAVQAK